MPTPEFNLLDEKWIRVIRKDGEVAELSLTDALLHAQEYMDLAGEMPTQDFCVLRLMEAVLLTVFLRADEKGEECALRTRKDALNRWERLWNMGAFPEKPIRDYLAKWHERFWLFHDERPFYQANEAKIGTGFSAAKLQGEMSESSNKLRLFPVCAGNGKSAMSYAEAARWLLQLNGYDDTSAKPKGKNLPSPGAGWLGKISPIWVKGDTLFETLMFNMTLLQDGIKCWEEECHPIWEKENYHPGERTAIPLPKDLPALYTLPSRLLLLTRDNGMVTGYRLLGGFFFPPEAALTEQMTIWGRREEKGTVTIKPRRHDPTRQIWRDFTTLFLPAEGRHLPGVVSYYEMLTNGPLCDMDKTASFSVAAIRYGDKDFFVNDTYSDSLSFSADILKTANALWGERITAEIAKVDETANAISLLAYRLSLACGIQKDGTSFKEQYYAQVDVPFRRWLAGLNTQSMTPDDEEIIWSWRDQSRQLAMQLANQMVSRFGLSAFSGRDVKDKKTDVVRHYSAPEAHNQFLRELNKIYREGCM